MHLIFLLIFLLDVLDLESYGPEGQSSMSYILMLFNKVFLHPCIVKQNKKFIILFYTIFF